jgi:tRNA-2-methylthio-N6-dimethylallyladenosine synthase
MEKIKKSYPYVDLIFGPHELWRFPELLEKTLAPHKGKIIETRQIDGELLRVCLYTVPAQFVHG